MQHRIVLVATSLFAACKPAGDAAPQDAGASVTVAAPASAAPAPTALPSAPASTPAATAGVKSASGYLANVAESKRILGMLTVRGDAAKAKLAKQPAAKQKAGEAALAAYEQKHKAVVDQLAKLPAAEPNAAKAEAASDAMMASIESLKGALDTLEGAAGVY